MRLLPYQNHALGGAGTPPREGLHHDERRLADAGPEEAAPTRVEDADLIEMCYMSRDFRHGLEAFLAKEKPEWSGT